MIYQTRMGICKDMENVFEDYKKGNEYRNKKFVSVESIIDEIEQLGVDVESGFFKSYKDGLLVLYNKLKTIEKR